MNILKNLGAVRLSGGKGNCGKKRDTKVEKTFIGDE
jgi:hypothetical protein